MISREMSAMIHIAKKDLKLSEERYREILREQGGVESSKDLGGDGVARVMNCFVAMGFKKRRKASAYQPPPRNANDLPTPEQLFKIRHLWTGLAEYIPRALARDFQSGFYAKILRISRLGPQTRAQANTVIEVLKKRVLQQARAAAKKPAEDGREQAV